MESTKSTQNTLVIFGLYRNDAQFKEAREIQEESNIYMKKE